MGKGSQMTGKWAREWRSWLRRPVGDSQVGKTDGTMQVLSQEKIKVLATRNGWSLVRAEGYIDGETCRRRGTTPSKVAQIGIDEYSLGFRAGYYERKDPGLTRSGKPGAPDQKRQISRRS